MPALSIVIPTLGRSRVLADVLTALDTQDLDPLDIEIIVVLDASALPGACEHLVDKRQPTPRVIQASRAGASGARNAGWRAAASPLILFLDDDVVPAPGLVREHLQWHTAHPEPEVAVLGRVVWSSRVKVTPFMRWLDSGIQFNYGAISGIEAGWGRLYSCNLSIKRKMLETVDGFDEQRFPYGYEDTELARRLSPHGLRVLYNMAATGEHHKTETLEGWRRNLRRIALAEHRFVTMYPNESPYFHDLFSAAATKPPARGRAARLARWVSPEFPWLGRRVWKSYDAMCKQRLGPEFLREWRIAADSRVEG
jgi:GT2 family glycosyltransferase